MHLIKKSIIFQNDRFRKIKQKLYVSDAFYKADVEFTEKGVKSVTITVILMGA